MGITLQDAPFEFPAISEKVDPAASHQGGYAVAVHTPPQTDGAEITNSIITGEFPPRCVEIYMETTKERELAIVDVILREPANAEIASPAVWATVRHFLPELDANQTAKVVSLILDICPICLAASRTCSCLNDE